MTTTATPNGITLKQNKVLHALLNSTGLTDSKGDMIEGLTEGRTRSSKDLTEQEAGALINWLQESNPIAVSMDKMRKLMISRAHRMDWKLEDGAADLDRLNAWCLSDKCAIRKPLMGYTYAELVKVCSQFGKVYESYLREVRR